jgi:succinate dehydrogenase / fumarate reductase cytochrome b subunit
MDMGYGFELKTTRITGLLVIFGSIFLTIIIFVLGKNFI